MSENDTKQILSKIDNNCKLENIISKYIIKNIFSFINEPNYIYKLINYSKRFQKKLNINLLNYKEIYFNERVNYDEYNYYKDRFHDYVNSKELLTEKYKKDILDYQINEKNIKIFILNYYKNYIKNKNNCLYKFSKNIILDSPFLEVLSKSDIFGQLFNIVIHTGRYIKEEEELKNISKFKELNKYNSQYSSITFDYFCKSNINLIKDLDINYKQLKKLIIKYDVSLNENCEILMNNLFSCDILNNLVYFELNLNCFSSTILQPKTFENINNFKSLEYLILNDVNFEPHFEFKLNNLKYLKIKHSSNIIFLNNNFFKLEYLKLYARNIRCKNNLLLICPELITLKLFIIDNSIIDTNNLKKLKIFKGKSDFLLLNNFESLEKIIIFDIGEINILKKIISLNTLQEISITDETKFEDYELFETNEKNYSVNKLEIIFRMAKADFDFNKFLNNFPNLSDFNIQTHYKRPQYSCGFKPNIIKKDEKIIIGENINSNINKINISLNTEGYTLKFNCKSYEKLEYISLSVDTLIFDYFPFFQQNNDKTFNSLKVFNCDINYDFKVALNFLENLFNNIDKMPNLRDFKLCCKKDFFFGMNKFQLYIKKLLTLKSIKNIYISLKYYSYDDDKPFSRDELNKLWPDINFNRFKIIHIYIDALK